MAKELKPRGSARPPLVITEEFKEKTVGKKRRGVMAKGTKDKVDYEYFLGVFEALKAKYEGRISEKATVITGNRKRTLTRYRYTPKQMFENLCRYFEYTLGACQPLTITGMGLFLEIDRQDLFEFIRQRNLPKEYTFIYDFASFCEMYSEFAAQKKQNPAGPIFILKNYGWKDKLEIEATSIEGALSEGERREAQKRINQFNE